MTGLLDTFLAVCIMAFTLVTVGYAVRTAWQDHKEANLPHEVLHRYEGKPREGWYFMEFATRKEAQAYLWELAGTEGVTEAHIIPTITCS